MTPTTAFANIRRATGSTFEAEIRTLQIALAAAKDDARKATKARGILEAALREIHEASKHQDRTGEKSGEAWEKELQKAENYLHRAWSGRWI